MKDRLEDKPAQRRLAVVRSALNLVRVTQRTSKDIEEKAEALELERMLLQRSQTLEAQAA